MKTIKGIEGMKISETQSELYTRIGYIQALKDIIKLIDSKTIECVMNYGKWFIDVEDLKARIEG